MAKFDDFEAVYEPLKLTIKGKTYTLEPVEAAQGARFTAAASGEEEAEFFSDDDLRQMLLGPLYQEMIDDGVSDAAIKRVQLTALADFITGRESAAMTWATGGDPKALEQYVIDNAPNRASKRSNAKAAATRTRTRASTSGTKSSPAKSPKQGSPSTGS